MNTGKKKCDTLKAIRRQIAERYKLEYNPSECTYEGDCLGTCPKCEEELRSLQTQLEEKGIRDIDLNIEIDNENNVIESEETTLQGDVAMPDDESTIQVTMGMPSPPFLYTQKKRVLYKECQIAGITFHDLKETWDELYEGADLALIRQKNNKHDKYAIAVALADDYDGDPDDFDFDYILGYVPRTENKHLATMMDMGWAEAFECELSQVNGSNPYKGSLYMKIYIVSKDEYEVEDTSHLLRVMELDDEEYEHFIHELDSKGCSYYRYGGFPPWEQELPKRGEKIVFLHRQDEYAQLYLMHCIAVGDDDASYFVEEKDSLHAVDDCCYYVFTNIKGPVTTRSENLTFLDAEEINKHQPEAFLSEEASLQMLHLIDNNG